MDTAPSKERTGIGNRIPAIALTWMIVVSLAGCVTTLDKGKRTAAMSQELYTAVQGQVTEQIVVIAKKDDSTITHDDRSRLKLLNALRKVLDDYSAAHNAYVTALQTWETSATRPAEIDQIAAKMISLVAQVQKMSKDLNLKLK
ncbi:MAG: hypothetical protein HKL90_12650 [Elusimicrobia bacterium]|nr:hypothetical protein [Elusimicrobiota bacterium]